MPSMVVIDTHLARGASNGGFTFHDRGGPYGATKGAKRVVAVDVTGLAMGDLDAPSEPDGAEHRLLVVPPPISPDRCAWERNAPSSAMGVPSVLPVRIGAAWHTRLLGVFPFSAAALMLLLAVKRR
jgi:hypothetical protein